MISDMFKVNCGLNDTPIVITPIFLGKNEAFHLWSNNPCYNLFVYNNKLIFNTKQARENNIV